MTTKNDEKKVRFFGCRCRYRCRWCFQLPWRECVASDGDGATGADRFRGDAACCRLPVKCDALIRCQVTKFIWWCSGSLNDTQNILHLIVILLSARRVRAHASRRSIDWLTANCECQSPCEIATMTAHSSTPMNDVHHVVIAVFSFRRRYHHCSPSLIRFAHNRRKTQLEWKSH